MCIRDSVKAMQSEEYARKVKITNLQQMANTLIYIQEHDYQTREHLSAVTSATQEKAADAQQSLDELSAELRTLNSQIHYTGQYFSSKGTYAEFIKSRKKKQMCIRDSFQLSLYNTLHGTSLIRSIPLESS